MPTPIECDNFVNELPKLFGKAKLNGSVRLTFKRFDSNVKKPTPKPRTGKKYQKKNKKKNAQPENNSSSNSSKASEPQCLIRAELNDKKVTTLLSHKDVTRFNIAFSTMLKSNIDGLKKKDRKAKKNAAT